MAKDFDKILQALRHDLRAAIHTANLNFEAAQTLAGKIKDANAPRLRKHLELIKTNIEKIEDIVLKASDDLR